MFKKLLYVSCLGLGAVSCQNSSSDNPYKQRLELEKNCERFDSYYVEIENSNFAYTQPLRFKIPAHGPTSLSYIQNEQQRATTPDDIFCVQPEVRFLKVVSIKLSHKKSFSGVPNNGENSIIPKGVYDISIPSRHRFRCSKNISLQTCRMLGEFSDLNLKFNYRIYPHDSGHTDGGSLEKDKWPYQFHPEGTWSMVEEDIRADLRSLMYQDQLNAK